MSGSWLGGWLNSAARRFPFVVMRRATLDARERNAFNLGVDAARGGLVR